jgi:hypothetical protein
VRANRSSFHRKVSVAAMPSFVTDVKNIRPVKVLRDFKNVMASRPEFRKTTAERFKKRKKQCFVKLILLQMTRELDCHQTNFFSLYSCCYPSWYSLPRRSQLQTLTFLGERQGSSNLYQSKICSQCMVDVEVLHCFHWTQRHEPV